MESTEQTTDQILDEGEALLARIAAEREAQRAAMWEARDAIRHAYEASDELRRMAVDAHDWDAYDAHTIAAELGDRLVIRKSALGDGAVELIVCGHTVARITKEYDYHAPMTRDGKFKTTGWATRIKTDQFTFGRVIGSDRTRKEAIEEALAYLAIHGTPVFEII